jgi:Vitamin K-dependent gamma-carboxylase
MLQIKNQFWQAWSEFWFRPRHANTLAVIRMFSGAMIAYIHLIWLTRVSDFFGPNAFVTRETVRTLHQNEYRWSYLWFIDSPSLLIAHETLAVLCGCLMAVGFLTRLTVPLTWFLTLMVCHRATGYLFGLDQVVMMLTMYLMIAPSGAVWSMDAWLRDKKSFNLPKWLLHSDMPSTMTTIATRLIQCHLAVVYLFGGIGKLRGEMWWDGSAMWFALASYEYQSFDGTWLGRYPFLLALVTHVTLFWEVFYCALIWPRWSRYVFLGMAVVMHAGIAIFLGMITFGFMMIVANMAFIEPEITRRIYQAALRLLRPKSSGT